MALDITINDPAIYTDPWANDAKLFRDYPNLGARPVPCVPSEELGLCLQHNFEGPDSQGPESLRTIGKRGPSSATHTGFRRPAQRLRHELIAWLAP